MYLTKITLIACFSFASISSFGLTNSFESSTQPKDENKILLGKLKSKSSSEVIWKIMEYIDNPLGWSAINYAIEKDDYQSAALLADYTSDVNVRDCAYLSNPNSHSKITPLERILLKAWHFNHQKNLTKDQTDLIHKLLDKGIAFNDVPPTGLGAPIIYFCYFNEKTLVAKLLDKGVDVNSYDGRPLELATARGHTGLVHYLMYKGADIYLANILHAAILSQKIELVELALNYGYNINEIDSIDIAINYTWTEVRNLNENDRQNLPALEMIHFLLEQGANPNWGFERQHASQGSQIAFKNSPLWKARNLLSENPTYCQKRYQERLIRMLINYGAFGA